MSIQHKKGWGVFVKFVHTYPQGYAIIITVKPPPIHYIVFATPHKKEENTFSEKDSRLMRCLFCV